MPKFLIKASYGADGVRGLIKEGGSKRRAVVQKMIEGMGGKLEALYTRSIVVPGSVFRAH